MPTYEFKCGACGKIRELELPITSNQQWTNCKLCNGVAQRIISKTSFITVGSGFPSKENRINKRG